MAFISIDLVALVFLVILGVTDNINVISVAICFVCIFIVRIRDFIKYRNGKRK